MYQRSSLRLMIAAVILMVTVFLTAGCSDNPTESEGTWQWQALGTGTNGFVAAVQVFNGRLYAGGEFTQAGGVAANYIAVWNDTVWAPLGVGTSWPVNALIIYDNKLIVGGRFGSAGGMVVNRVAAYDGSNWSALGAGLPGDVVVNDFCIVHDSLFAVGEVGINMDAERFVAVWDGSTWGMIESGIPGLGKAACTYQNNIVTCGTNYIVNTTYSYVRQLSAGVWYDIDPGHVPTNVRDVCVWDNTVYVCGSSFFPVKYMSTSWTDVGSDAFAEYGYLPTARVMCVFNGNLVVGGQFASIGDKTVNGIAAWNGSDWSALGSGIAVGGSGAYCLTVADNKLYMGGIFEDVGGVTVNNIAVWVRK